MGSHMEDSNQVDSEVAHVCDPRCDDYCYSCNRHEPIPPEYYRMCHECFHVYVTEKELVDEHNALLRNLGATVAGLVSLEKPLFIKAGIDVWTCPKCIHDF